MNNSINGEVVEGLQLTGTAATYARTSHQLFNRDSRSGWEWEKQGVMDGYIAPMDESFVFQDGKLWAEPVYFSPSTGPSRLGIVWDIYCNVSGESRKLMVGREFSFDAEQNTLTVFDTSSVTYMVEAFNEQRMTMSLVEHYEGGRTGEGGDHMFRGVYKRVSTDRMDKSGLLAFDSQYECDRYIWEKAYERFGRYINLNEYLSGVILDNPIVDLDAIEPQMPAE